MASDRVCLSAYTVGEQLKSMQHSSILCKSKSPLDTPSRSRIEAFPELLEVPPFSLFFRFFFFLTVLPSESREKYCIRRALHEFRFLHSFSVRKHVKKGNWRNTPEADLPGTFPRFMIISMSM